MNKRNIATGIFFIIIGVWFYLSLSSFEIEKGTDPKTLVIRQGILRTDTEIAEALASETGFDLKGAYQMGYSPRHVVDYLMKRPHKLLVAYYDGEFYEGRITVPYIYPLTVCIIVTFIGIGMVIFTGKRREEKPPH